MDFNPRLIRNIGHALRHSAPGHDRRTAGRLTCVLRLSLRWPLACSARELVPRAPRSIRAYRPSGFKQLAPGFAAGRGGSLLGRPPGSGGVSNSANLPGAGGILGGRPGVSTPKGIPTAVSTPGAGAGPTDLQMPITAPQPEPVSPTTTPFYGTLEIVGGRDDDGPPDGLTLDRAIDITLERSLDLRSKFFEIPMARADTLQANLRSNPVFYQDGQLLQYRGSPFNRAAPGGPQQFDTNITYPLDISHKRQARTVVATRAERVLEAMFQEAVRQRIDDVYGAFVDGPGRAPDGSLRKGERHRARNARGPQRATVPERRHLARRLECRCGSGSGRLGSAWSMPRQPTARPSSSWDRS